MSHYLILLTPVLIVLIVAAFGFTGCSSFTTADDIQTQPGPPLVVAPPDPVTTQSYQDVVTATGGFAAMWPLNESAGNQTAVVGPLNPQANGVYLSKPPLPAGTGYTLGADGVLIAKDKTDRAPEFNGQGAWVEVQYVPQLNTANNVPFSVELWAKPNATSVAPEQVLISSHRIDSATVDQGYEIRLVKNAAQVNHEVHAKVFANGQPVAEAKVVPTGGAIDDWRHIVLVYENRPGQGWTITLHVRLAGSAGGFQDGPHATKYESITSANPAGLRFAAGHAAATAPDRFFAGRIDNVAFYNAAISQTDIDKHFSMF